MSKLRIELNGAGVRELLRSSEMKAICGEQASEIAQRCGDGYSYDTYTGQNRVNAEVRAETWEARRDNSENNTILKAMRGG